MILNPEFAILQKTMYALRFLKLHNLTPGIAHGSDPECIETSGAS